MTDINDTDELNKDDAEKKKKKGGKGEIDGIGQKEVQVSQEFYTYMNSIGAPASLVARVLQSWRHLRGEGLRRALADFARRVASRATAHVEVKINKENDYGLVHNIIQYLKSIAGGPDQRHKIDHTNRFDPK